MHETKYFLCSNIFPRLNYLFCCRWGWITLYVVTIVVAVLGNLLFIIGSLCTRRSRNTGHYLLINLSIRWVQDRASNEGHLLGQHSDTVLTNPPISYDFCVCLRPNFTTAYCGVNAHLA